MFTTKGDSSMSTDVTKARAPAEISVDSATIAVVIPTFNHTHFLADAINSVLRQTRPADEIIVVDDGSTDNPDEVVDQFPSVLLIRQDNRGISAARNAGLRSCSATHVVFLDADDLLLPCALETGLTFWKSHPDCAFVYGGYRNVSKTLEPIKRDAFYDISANPHLELLSGNVIGAHHAVLYRRDRLIEINGFDESLRYCEDYDIFLRITWCYPVAGYPTTVALVRRHGQNMSTNYGEMLRSFLTVLDKHEARIQPDAATRAAIKRGKTIRRDRYAAAMLGAAAKTWRGHRAIVPTLWEILRIVMWSPTTLIRVSFRKFDRRTRKTLTPFAIQALQRLRGRRGNLNRVSPLSRAFGFDRGTPIDRYYIERFLANNAGDIRGRVLEIGDNHYTLRFGGAQVEQSDILHVSERNPKATFIGDLTQPNCLPDSLFDCIILTQTLHLLFDMREGLATLYRALKPGGVLLMTVPGISEVNSGQEWGETWYWSLTVLSTRRLLKEQFKSEDVHVESHGNVFAAAAFLYGLACEEVPATDLDMNDLSYPVTIAARAIKTAPA